MSQGALPYAYNPALLPWLASPSPGGKLSMLVPLLPHTQGTCLGSRLEGTAGSPGLGIFGTTPVSLTASKVPGGLFLPACGWWGTAETHVTPSRHTYHQFRAHLSLSFPALARKVCNSTLPWLTTHGKGKWLRSPGGHSRGSSRSPPGNCSTS